ncbi:hypothetical protein ACLOJK_030961 [Asimina triloba]
MTVSKTVQRDLIYERKTDLRGLFLGQARDGQASMCQLVSWSRLHSGVETYRGIETRYRGVIRQDLGFGRDNLRHH